ncbi:MAG: hypothetical protein WAR21_12105, partial [Candidatus Acidiferrales bacterium]
AQAVGDYQQSLAGGRGNPGGMQAMMERMMKDPAYQARFEKMSKQEQEAEIRKFMGNAQAPPPPAGETAAERQAKQATTETTAVLAKQKELFTLIDRVREIDAEFAKKDQAILATPGGHDQIAKDVAARIAKLPVFGGGEADPIPDPVKLQALQREQATRDRARSTWELQQRTALFGQRKARYKELATAYATWLKQNVAPTTSQTAQLLDDATAEAALTCEQELISATEKLGQYSSEVTWNAALYESFYQKKMAEPAARPISR